MPSIPWSRTLTGISTTSSDYPTYFPDISIRPFSLSVQTVVNSTNVAYTVRHSNDYTGSSTFISTAATWFPSTGTTAATTNSFAAYTYPVTAIQIVSTAGSSAGTIAITIVQAG